MDADAIGAATQNVGYDRAVNRAEETKGGHDMSQISRGLPAPPEKDWDYAAWASSEGRINMRNMLGGSLGRYFLHWMCELATGST